ncbi:MAG: beta-galactosidase [Janthinobacterium lividum]
MQKEEPIPLTVNVETPRPPAVEQFALGTADAPDGRKITVSSQSLRLNGKPWLPVMGEFHYARYPETEWRRELLKMRAGGIDIVATYVFWIHHEEQEGLWDWSGRRSLREFVRLCGEAGMQAVVRVGPWCHGEVRNGGFPDWLLAECGSEVRSDAAVYLGHTRRLFEQIAGQLDGLLWKDGGPVVGVQVENEYGGPAEHLLSLKRLAIDAGLDVPVYTRTGWPDLATPMPPGELMPLFGGYPDGFWDRSLVEMPRGYRGAYLFTHIRADAAIATDQLGERSVSETSDDALYPYFACEIGGGMEPSYHRRIRIAPMDIASLALVKLGSGGNLQGYYMYHGGTNPEGLLSTLEESQATGYWNDVPTKSYDFQAPLGAFGQVREHYHRLRLLHLLLRDFGPSIAALPSVLPDERPANADDIETLRWSVRSDGRSGMIFVNNYQRLQPMPPKEGVQFHLCLPASCLHVPASPVTVPADSAFVWPFALDLGGIVLSYATAQPVCRLETPEMRYAVFAQTPGVPSEFHFDGDGWVVTETTGQYTGLSIADVQPGTGAAIVLHGPNSAPLSIILLDAEQSLNCWKETLAGRERLFLSPAALIVDGETLCLSVTHPTDLHVSVLPPLGSVLHDGELANTSQNGLFQRFSAALPEVTVGQVTWQSVQMPGPARHIQRGGEGVAEAPSEADFDQAAVWRVQLPSTKSEGRRFLLRISYAGDVARLYAGERLLTDNFYNGTPFEIGLDSGLFGDSPEELLLKILPLRSDAPIYLPADTWPDFQGEKSAVTLFGIELIEEHEVRFDTANAV